MSTQKMCLKCFVKRVHEFYFKILSILLLYLQNFVYLNIVESQSFLHRPGFCEKFYTAVHENINFVKRKAYILGKNTRHLIFIFLSAITLRDFQLHSRSSEKTL